MPKYKKRADGRYATSVIVGCRDDGKPKLKTIYGKTIRELDAKVADFRSLQNKGVIIDDKNLTVGDWAYKWLDLYKKDKEYNTYAMYKNTIDNHIVPAVGAVRLNALKTHQVQELLNSLVQDGKLRTAELVKLTLSQMIKQAIIEEYIYKDITIGLTLPKHKKSSKRALTDAEKTLILNADFSAKERAFVDLIYYTGLRRGEALALSAGDIDFVNKTVSVNKNLVIKDNKSEIKPSPKSEAGNRSVPMPDKLVHSLMAHIRESNSLYLFPMKNGAPMTRSAFRRFWDNILDNLNIAAGGDKFTRSDSPIKPPRLIADDITPHIFRHTYATSLYYAGIDIKTAQYLLGHSSIQMTLDIYTHLDNSKIIGSADKLNSFFG